MYVPGCFEHYLVHIMRAHEDFIPELDFVITLNDEIIGNIMYTKAKLTDADGNQKEIVTFGPVSIKPKYQRNGLEKCSSNILGTGCKAWVMKRRLFSEVRQTM